MTYVEIVNEVLKRLREETVDSVTLTEYSTLIGLLVNEAKREVEDAHQWSSLDTDITVTTSPGVRDYTLTGTNHRTVLKFGYNQSKKWFLDNTTRAVLVKLQELNFTPVYNDVLRFTMLKRDATGQVIVRVDPYPVGTEQLVFNCKVPQLNLVNNLDSLLIPEEPVILRAYSLAIAERGEDSGQGSQQAENKYLTSLRDHISIDKNGNDDDTVWVAT
jgi:hypothetical protein